MKKIILMVFGTIFLSMGLMDYLAGALTPHIRFLVVSGTIIWAIVGVLNLWQKNQDSKTMPLIAVMAPAYDSVLNRPENTPIQQWSPYALTAGESWAIAILIAITIGLAIWLFKLRRGSSMFSPAHRKL